MELSCTLPCMLLLLCFEKKKNVRDNLFRKSEERKNIYKNCEFIYLCYYTCNRKRMIG